MWDLQWKPCDQILGNVGQANYTMYAYVRTRKEMKANFVAGVRMIGRIAYEMGNMGPLPY